MIVSYLPRLACLCLACFFLVHLALGLLVRFLTPTLLRKVETLRPRTAATVLLAVRLFPAGFALVVVFALCVPSYLRLEPDAVNERIGPLCLAAAILASILWASSVARAVAAVFRSRGRVQFWQSAGQMQCLADESALACVVKDTDAVFALTGLLRTQIVVSDSVLKKLSDDQLRLALQHERAHQESRDNLKRLLVLLAPGLFPFYSGFREIEQRRARSVEWAADDAAVSGDEGASVLLAETLVAVARLVSGKSSPALASPLLAASDDLPARVDRLLCPSPMDRESRTDSRWIVPVLCVVSLATVAFAPFLTSATYEFLEFLVG